MYDVYEIRKDFPELALTVNGRPNTYLDTAASALKPEAVVEKMMSFYRMHYSNVHRGAYYLSEQATAEYEKARETVARFVNAGSREIVFTRSATESINLAAASWGMHNLKSGDEILLSEAEHHANLVPWQMVRDQTGCTLNFFAVNDDGSFNPENFYRALTPRTKLVGVAGISNVLGTVFPVKEIAAAAHANGALCLVDACQSVVHQKIDVKDIGCDFLAFSGHKTMGPAGIGVLYGKKERLDVMEPLWYGGGMVDVVGNEDTSFTTIPYRLEAGTPNYPGAIGLGQALHYLQEIGTKEIAAWEKELTDTLEQRLSERKYVHVLGGNVEKQSVISVVVDGIHPYDMASFLNKYGIAVRSGNHCAQPMLRRLGYDSVIRFSPAFYNTKEEIEVIGDRMEKIISFLKKW